MIFYIPPKNQKINTNKVTKNHLRTVFFDADLFIIETICK